eukprot:TRINITY_DN7787_c0_g1_i1.p1 TRINITY_DN7787_c0_g1~~TRINITY_DN7787_c0_g1_i1.p1  ORF type:complete len:238 (-),score=68.62 TRINITY_DN7787_c0_g1_i1:45-758(-)
MIARSEDRLNEFAQELESKYKIQTKRVVVNFSSRDDSIYKNVEAAIEGIDVGILVNNVGINTRYPKFFLEQTSEMDDIVHVNIDAPNKMTALILPRMVAKKFGAIINLSSASCLEGQDTPLFSVYAATKAYNKRFSESLAYEYAKDGIEVLCAVPYFVASKMSRSRKGSLLVQTETHFARNTLDKLGYNYKTIIPWWNHFIQYIMTRDVPMVGSKSIGAIYGMRKRGMQVEANKKKE